MNTSVHKARAESRSARDPYAAIVDFYDLEHGDFTDDLDLYVHLGEMIGDPIVEVGCGTGRILIPLAQAGHRVTGIDSSTAMLARAEQAAARAGVSDQVLLSLGEMTDVAPSPHG